MNQVKTNWDAQPFLERLLFLMNEYKLSQSEAEVLAKLNSSKVNEQLNHLLN